MKSAHIRKPHVLAFCRKVVPDAKPVYVPVQDAPRTRPNECFSNVRGVRLVLGGEIVVGWSIWEWPRVLIEAEFHAVLRLPSGKLIDVTPRERDLSKITFVSDARYTDRGQRVDNIRKPLGTDPAIANLIALHERHFVVANELEVVDERRQAQLLAEERQLVDDIVLARHRLEERYG